MAMQVVQNQWLSHGEEAIRAVRQRGMLGKEDRVRLDRVLSVLPVWVWRSKTQCQASAATD